MPRAIAFKQNGRWLVKVDVDQYGGEDLSRSQALAFANDITNAAREARANAERDKTGVR